MKINRQKSNWILDVLLFAGFLVAFALDWTGVSMHQWTGVFGGLLATWHLYLHWDWVTAVTGRFFGKTSVQARIYYLLDAAILSGFYLIVMTGLVVSTWLDLALTNYAAWSDLHVTVSIVTLLLLALKIGLHWRWIVRVSRQPILQPVSQPVHALRAAPGTVLATSGSMTRRDFLKLMAIVGTASLAAASFTLNDNNEAQAAIDTTSSSASANRSAAQSTGSTATTSCSVQCNRRCSSPGGCHRYRDTNGNNYCDFGECG